MDLAEAEGAMPERFELTVGIRVIGIDYPVADEVICGLEHGLLRLEIAGRDLPRGTLSGARGQDQHHRCRHQEAGMDHE